MMKEVKKMWDSLPLWAKILGIAFILFYLRQRKGPIWVLASGIILLIGMFYLFIPCAIIYIIIKIYYLIYFLDILEITIFLVLLITIIIDGILIYLLVKKRREREGG